jgi:hypothetical protein
MMDSVDKKRKHCFSLTIDVSGLSEKSCRELLRALAEECAKS